MSQQQQHLQQQQQPAKRYACDRCRDQKLRCLRLEHARSTDPCARCLRAGAVCVSSSPRPLGRPRTTTASNGSKVRTPPTAIGAGGGGGRQKSRGISDSAAGSPRRGSRSTAVASSSTPIRPMMDDYPDLSVSGAVTPGTGAGGGLPSWMSSDIGSLFGLRMPDGDAATLLDPLSTLQDHRVDPELSAPSSQQHILHGSRQQDLMGPHSGVLEACGMGDIHGNINMFGDTTTDIESGGRDEPSHSSSSTIPEHPLVALSRLNENIAQQVAKLNSYAWRAPEGQGPCVDKVHEPSGNPMAQVLQSTSDFIAVLERLHPRGLSPSPHLPPSPPFGSDQGEPPLPQPPATQSSLLRLDASPLGVVEPLGTPMLLLLLSSYLQLMQLYDSIFIRIVGSLRELQDVIGFFQAAPEFRIAGLPSMKGHLYIKILMQMIEHHLDSVERLMGLPAEFCLSGRMAHANGIFSKTDSISLLHIAMAQGDSGTERSGRVLVPSLRENMKNVQALLQG